MSKAIIPKLVRSSADELRARLPAAVAETTKATGGRGEGRAVQVVMPQVTLAALKRKAADTDTTVRSVILQAIAKAGYPVPADELGDRRKG